MYLILILFFISLLGIIFMIGRKMMLLQSGHVLNESETIFKIPYEEWKIIAIRNVKKHGYKGLVAIIRFYVRFSNLLKNKYAEAKIKVTNLRIRKSGIDLLEKREVNKFLKMISEYKQKIREIKHKIHEEEKNL